MITYFNIILEENFNKYLKNYFEEHKYYSKSSDFNNYYTFINDLDKFSDSFVKEVLKSYFEYIDEVFFNSSYRKNFCSSKGFYERKNYVTLFGEITFKRRYYFDKRTNEYFFFSDLFLGLPKRKHFDPFVCSEIVKSSTEGSYSKAGKTVAEKIGRRIDNNINISRATARNIVMGFDYKLDEEQEVKRIKRLFVMLDEKFVGSQFNNGKDHMIKAAVIFEDTKLEYKSKRKIDSIDRYRLVNSHTCASIDNSLTLDVIDYIYSHYDTDYLDEICFMGDCAKWIKKFPKSCWFKFNEHIKNTFSMDGFHFSQALNHLTTNKNEHWYNALKYAAKNNNPDLFRRLCLRFASENLSRESTIISKMEYILNNWNERQLYQNNNYLKCSMESHISHIFADIFTSRPKAYSKKGLDKLLKLRLLKVNGTNIKQLYLSNVGFIPNSQSNVTISKNTVSYIQNKYDIEYTTIFKNRFNYLKEIFN